MRSGKDDAAFEMAIWANRGPAGSPHNVDWDAFDQISFNELANSDRFASTSMVSRSNVGPSRDAAPFISSPNLYSDYDLATKDGMRKFLDDKSWQLRAGEEINGSEIATAKALLSNYFGFEGQEKLMFKAWDNISMNDVDSRFSFYTKPDSDASVPFVNPQFASSANADTVSNYSRRIIDTIATAAELDTRKLVITSTIRTPEDQARIMFGQLRENNISRYGAAGRAVINTYQEFTQAGASATETRNAMRDTIQTYLDRGQRVSNHLGNPEVMNVFDIAPSSINKKFTSSWENSLDAAMNSGTIDRYLGPRTKTYEPAYHLEISQPTRRRWYWPSMKNSKICHLIASIALSFCMVLSANSEEQRPTLDIVKLEKLPYLEKRQLSELRILLGSEYQSFENMMRKRFPDFMLVNSCQGSFTIPGQRDFALALINSKSNTAVYAAMLSDRNGGFLFYDLYRFSIKFSKDGFVDGRGVEINCPAWTELHRINSDYSSRAKRIDGKPSLKIRTQLDAVCGSPTDGDNEFICFQYHTGNRNFIFIGGWSNE